MKVRYNQVTGEIDQWGENPQPESGKAILNDVDDSLLQYLMLIDARVVNGVLQYDETKLQALTAP